MNNVGLFRKSIRKIAVVGVAVVLSLSCVYGLAFGVTDSVNNAFAEETNENNTTILPEGVDNSGLEVYYKFDDSYEASGRAMAKDSSPNQRDLYYQHNSGDHSLSSSRLVEGINSATNEADKAFCFDGQGVLRAQKLGESCESSTHAGKKYYINTKQDSQDTDYSFTVSYLLKINQFNNSTETNHNGYNIVVDTNEASGSDKANKPTFISTVTNSNFSPAETLRAGITPGDGGFKNDQNIDMPGKLETDTWTLITYVVHDTNEDSSFSLYINGILTQKEELNDVVSRKGHCFGTSKTPWGLGGLIKLKQGSSWEDEVVRGLDGAIDEFMIFSRAITPNEVVAIAQSYNGIFVDGEYKVQYNLNGGNLPNDASEVYKSSQSMKLPVPTKEDKAFAGWFDNEACTGSPLTEIEAGNSGNKQLWAKWIGAARIINFAGGESAELEYSFKTVNEELQVGALPNAIRHGYTLIGWFTEEIGGIQFQEDTIFNYKEDITLYAQWLINKYTIVLNPNGGYGADNFEILEYTVEDETITLPTDMRKEGYKFLGWYDNPDFQGKLVTEIKNGSTGAKNFWAKWTVYVQNEDYEEDYPKNEVDKSKIIIGIISGTAACIIVCGLIFWICIRKKII